MGEPEPSPGTAPASRRAFLRHAGMAAAAAGLAACTGTNTTTGAAAGAPAVASSGGSNPTPSPAGAVRADAAVPTSAPARPSDSPATDLTQSGLLWTGARLLMTTVPVDPAAAATWLPPALKMASPATATVFAAWYPLTMFGSAYHEAAVLLHVEHDTGPAWHCPWMVVDDDTALVLGRELLGFPKKMADIALTETSDRIVGTVSRKGAPLMSIDAPAPMTPEPGGVWTSRLMNVHGSFVSGLRLLEVKPLTEQVHERSAGRATVTLHSAPRDDLGPLVPEPTEGDAVFAVCDFGALANGGLPFGDAFPAEWAWNRQLRTAL